MRKSRIIVKIGSSSLTEKAGHLSTSKINYYAARISQLTNEGHQVILISSGAVAAGFKLLGYPSRPVTISGKQAAAATGQSLLMQRYAEAFHQQELTCAQLLLTKNDFINEEQYSNASNTINELLKRRIIPIINENDSTITDELTFGDNDMLSALVSGFLHADRLIILTDIDGIYNDNPLKNPHAKKYHQLNEITEEILSHAQGSSTKIGTGGMASKLRAAKTALSLGVHVFIGTGNDDRLLINILEGQGNGTYLSPTSLKVMRNKKQWIAYHSKSNGRIYIDDGAETAMLKRGKSLLPIGITSVEGDFQQEDVIEVFNQKGLMIGKGKINYHAKHLQKIISESENKKTKRIEAIHRDQWIPY
ncbi:glutamate 5-kinase [Salipaludibacillus keqinensis]|uniref:Glutamate 5-kinase n=1 Tax=Salipaludibacillus keqinensis TaxID=2045207 RepID=A0A323TN98_9BACI|nr:glutamate 5-kinase [Salipaludibacillus keqinensis]PYZ95157.1 glutamate 5-kinase [Salipaludibacillus keqinensis]